MCVAELYNDFADEDIPDVGQDIPDADQSELDMEGQPPDEPAVDRSVSPSTSVTSSVPRPGRPSPSQPEHMCPSVGGHHPP